MRIRGREIRAVLLIALVIRVFFLGAFLGFSAITVVDIYFLSVVAM